VYPWLDENNFEGARSGWQTRTLERPKAYNLDYPENIQYVKDPFLVTFDEVEEKGQSAANALVYLINAQLIRRETNRIALSIPRTQDIQLIVKIFSDHFFYPYAGSRGGSRLPVLAIYAIYKVLMAQTSRFDGMTLKPLEEHSAADAQTGALGDIEIQRDNGEIFEAIEIKHNMQLSSLMIRDVATKIMNKAVDRYYILTTHSACEPSLELADQIGRIKALYNCQLIGNGVIPSIKYYLRMLSDPSAVFPAYVELLAEDGSVDHEHRASWNTLSTQG
jgi:DNA (cytosine-5)-methyltransferase 1